MKPLITCLLITIVMFFLLPIPFSFVIYTLVLSIAASLALYMAIVKSAAGWAVVFVGLCLGGGFYLLNNFFGGALKGDRFILVGLFQFLLMGTVFLAGWQVVKLFSDGNE